MCNNALAILVHCDHLWSVLYMIGNMADIFHTCLDGESHTCRVVYRNTRNSSEGAPQKNSSNNTEFNL